MSGRKGDAVLLASNHDERLALLALVSAFDEAAKAYELFLDRHPHDRRVIETAMLLAVLYVRKRPAPDKALRILDHYGERFRTQGHATLADALREEVPS